MPRKNPLSPKELEICHRLAAFRINATGLTRPRFAEKLNIDSDRLANYEFGRTIIRWQFAFDLVTVFKLNPEWLAEGKGAMTIAHGHAFFSGPTKNLPFSEVYATTIKPRMIEHRQLNDLLLEALILQRSPTVPDDFDAGSLSQKVLNLIFQAALELPPKALMPMLAKLLRVSADSLMKTDLSEQNPNAGEKNLILEPHQIKSQVTLDKVSQTTDNTAVQKRIGSLSSLIKTLRHFTKTRGAKTALASELGVSRQAVDQWLSGESKPTAEAVFKLLKWVEQR